MSSWLSRIVTVVGVVACLLSFPKAAFGAGAPRVHDNVFFHLGISLGPSWLVYDAPMNTGTRHEGTVTNFAPGRLELALGGTPAEGFVLAAMGVGNVMSNPSFDNDRILEIWEDATSSSFALAALARYYPDTTGGLHVDAFVGPAQHVTRHWRTVPPDPFECIFGPAACTDKRIEAEEKANGVLVGVGGGYDFWVGREWSIGPGVRAEVAPTWASQGTYTFFSATLGFMATLH